MLQTRDFRAVLLVVDVVRCALARRDSRLAVGTIHVDESLVTSPLPLWRDMSTAVSESHPENMTC